MELLSQIFYYPFLNLLTFLVWATPGHYAAIGIVLLTLIVRFILLIPTQKSAQGQRRMAQLQPLLAELKTEHEGDQAGMAAAQMELYKKNGINPFSSCGFLAIQLPILALLNHTFTSGLASGSVHLYSWLPKPDSINYNFFGINVLHPDPYYVIPVLVALIQFIQIKLTLPPAPKKGADVDPQVAVQRNMMYVMPAVMLFIARSLSSGVGLYWFVSNIFAVIQQLFVNKERLSLKGVEKIVSSEEAAHPQFTPALEKAKAETLGKETKKGVNITVRRKR